MAPPDVPQLPDDVHCAIQWNKNLYPVAEVRRHTDLMHKLALARGISHEDHAFASVAEEYTRGMPGVAVLTGEALANSDYSKSRIVEADDILSTDDL
jgi:hypothetical protein